MVQAESLFHGVQFGHLELFQGCSHFDNLKNEDTKHVSTGNDASNCFK